MSDYFKQSKYDADTKLYVNLVAYIFLFLCLLLIAYGSFKYSNDLREKAVANCVEHTEMDQKTCEFLAR